MVLPLALPPAQLAAAADGTLDVSQLGLGLKAAGLDDVAGLADGLATELSEQARTSLAQERAAQPAVGGRAARL